MTLAPDRDLRTASGRVLWLLVRRDLRLRYAGAFLGYAWSVLEPLLMALVYALVFGVLIGARDIGHQPYVLFLLVGVLAWNWFSTVLNDACRSLTSEARIVRSANVPRHVWVMRTVLSRMAEFLLALPVVVAFALVWQVPPTWGLSLLPLALLLQFALSTGIALVLAPLAVIVGDVVRLVRVALRIGFYLSPVLYSLAVVGEGGRLADVAAFNPMAAVLSLYRATFWPDELLSWGPYAWATSASVAALVIGMWTFRRLEGAVLKEI